MEIDEIKHSIKISPNEIMRLYRKNERLKKAMNEMPWPIGFLKGAVAIRGIIREKKKGGETCEQELLILYWLAAINSFFLPHSAKLCQPGWNVLEAIPASQLYSLDYDYNILGYEQLGLLKATDIKWITGQWGIPFSHITLNQQHYQFWKLCEAQCTRKQENDMRKLLRKIR